MNPFADKIGNSRSSWSSNRVGPQTIYEHYQETEVSRVIDACAGGGGGGADAAKPYYTTLWVHTETVSWKFWNGDYLTWSH